MQQNENKTLLFTEMPEKESILRIMAQDETVSAMQIGLNPLVLDFTPKLTIPAGFRWNEELPITWRLSIDQHMLHAVSTLLRVETPTQRALYLATLLGSISWNQVITGFEPIKGGTYIICGCAGPNNQFAVSSATGSNVIFNSYGLENINEALGYAFSKSEIQYLLCNSFTIDVVLENPSVILPDGTVVTFNPANPTAFFSLFNGQQDLTFVQRVNVIITPGFGPNS